MPSFIFFLASLVVSHLVTRGCAEMVSESYIIPDNDLQKHCSFDLNGYVYDLCPLTRSTKVVEVLEEEWRLGSGRYVLALGGLGVGNNLVKSPGSSCSEETWVCLISVHEHGFRHIPVIQKVKGGNLTLIVEVTGDLEHGPGRSQLKIRGTKKDLDVVFNCSETETVELIDGGSDTLRFMWASRHGCPRKSSRRRGSKKSTLIMSTDGEQEPDGSEEQEGDDELLPSDSRKARTGIALVITFMVVTVICGTTLASSARTRRFLVEHLRNTPHAVVPLLAQVGVKLRPLGQSLSSLTSKAMSASSVRFRPGDDNLVRWAEEEMALDSDMMVNGSQRAYRFDEENWDSGTGEYIPLATSPRFGTGRLVQSYGSTPEAEMATSQGRGVISRMRRYLKI